MTHESRGAFAGSRARRFAVAFLAVVLVAGAGAAEEYGEPIVLTSLAREIDRDFGAAVAIDGDTLAVGVPRSPEGGVVYVYERRRESPDGWELVAVVKGVNPGTDEAFGTSVALDGETLVVGAPLEEARAYHSGAAYVFYRHRGNSSRWGRVKTLVPKNLQEEWHAGTSVAISGDHIAVGAPGAAKVYVHRRHLPIRHWWGVEAELQGEVTSRVLRDHYGISGPAPGFGRSVTLSGKTLVVGAMEPYWALRGGTSYGLYVFYREEVDPPAVGRPHWRQVLNYESPALRRDGAVDDFATMLGLDGPILLAGGGESLETGCYIYERNYHGTNRWGLRAELRDSAVEIHEVGGVAARGKTTAVAAQFRSLDPIGYGHGALVYERHVPTRNSWSLAARLTSPEVTEPAESVAIGPREVVTGHPGAGVVLIYPRAPIVAADFEDGDTTGLSQAMGNVEVVSPGLEETDYALAVEVDGSTKRSMVRAWQPYLETTVSLGFNLAVNRVNLAGRKVEVMNLYNPYGDLVRLTLEDHPVFVDAYLVRLWAWEQGDVWREVGKAWMPPKKSVRMEIDWRVATGPGHDNGRVRLFTNGVLRAQATDLDTDLQFVGGLLLGLPKGSQGTAGGAFLLDEIELHR